MVVMTARPMNMTVREFFIRCDPHTQNFDIKMQGLSRHGVVTIEHDFTGLFADLGNG